MDKDDFVYIAIKTSDGSSRSRKEMRYLMTKSSHDDVKNACNEHNNSLSTGSYYDSSEERLRSSSYNAVADLVWATSRYGIEVTDVEAERWFIQRNFRYGCPQFKAIHATLVSKSETDVIVRAGGVETSYDRDIAFTSVSDYNDYVTTQETIHKEYYDAGEAEIKEEIDRLNDELWRDIPAIEAAAHKRVADAEEQKNEPKAAEAPTPTVISAKHAKAIKEKGYLPGPNDPYWKGK